MASSVPHPRAPLMAAPTRSPALSGDPRRGRSLRSPIRPLHCGRAHSGGGLPRPNCLPDRVVQVWMTEGVTAGSGTERRLVQVGRLRRCDVAVARSVIKRAIGLSRSGKILRRISGTWALRMGCGQRSGIRSWPIGLAKPARVGHSDRCGSSHIRVNRCSGQPGKGQVSSTQTSASAGS